MAQFETSVIAPMKRVSSSDAAKERMHLGNIMQLYLLYHITKLMFFALQ